MKQTTLDLNGPILSYVQQPSSTSIVSAGVAKFVAIATATFPTQTPINPATNTGSLSYNWYAEGVGKLSNGDFRGSTLSGTATTTLTITNPVSPNITSLNFYAGVDYVPSAYSSSSVVTVGTARSTGNAINEILLSNSASLVVFPKIIITTQPSDVFVNENTSASFSVVAAPTDITQGNLSYQWMLNDQNLVNGSSSGIVVSGATTPNLLVTYPYPGIYSVKVKITHPTSGDSPLFSNTVQFSVIAITSNVVTEIITSSSNTASIQTQDLIVNNQITLLAQNYTDPSTLVSLYAKDRNVNVEMELYGGKGNNSGGYSGGQGGYSKIRFTMIKNEEYVIAGLNASDNNPYVYRKGALIAVVGKGGDATQNGAGGVGGGIGISGGTGAGRAGGTGGQAITSGNLPAAGIFGSLSSSTAQSPDTKASTPNGGRMASCSKGTYWNQQGFSPCQDVGTSQFRLGNGTLITNTGSITRGYKAGYNILQTGGSGVSATTQSNFISRTCTRTIPRTSYRTVSRSVTKRTSFNHVFNNVPGDFRTVSFTSSGDPMTGTVNIDSNGGNRSYTINTSGLGLNSTNYSVSVTNTNQAAAGDFPGIAVNSITQNGFSINITFRNLTNNAIGFCRDFTVTVNGTADFSEAYDSSYTENYDCSYTETITISGGANGGSGATGGAGGGSESAGGGGSGYSDGSVQVLESTSGGNSGNAKIIIRATNA